MIKKLLTLTLVAAFTFSLVACGDEGEKNTGDGAEVKQSEAVENDTSADAEANEDYFVWDDNPHRKNRIVDLTPKGQKQKELVIPARCEDILLPYENVEYPEVKYVRFENPNTEILSIICLTGMEGIELPANMVEIDSRTFMDCANLKSIVIPDTVKEIGSSAFTRCTALEDVTLNSGLEIIGREAFNGCSSLKKITIPDTVTELKNKAFHKCEALEEISFGSGLQTIGESAFLWCSSLKTVTVPEGVISLGADAFAQCEILEEIYLPASITEADVSCITQPHTIKVYVKEGSYMDGRIADLVGVKFYDKQYY